jgi:PKD repeat protein
MKALIKRTDSRKMIICAILLAVLGLCISILPVQSGPAPSIILDKEILGTGLLEGTATQKDWMSKNVPIVASVRLNTLALERLNEDRVSRGLPAIMAEDAGAVNPGEELVYSDSSELLGRDMLPISVDNSATIYFPPIRSQGSLGSCVAWSTTYYTFTYEINYAMGRAANTGDNNVIFSPKWTYNMINYGANNGAYFSDAFYLLTKHGAATWAEFPYDTNYLQWCLDTDVWRNAINYRAAGWSQVYNADTSALIAELKTQLANGHVMVIGTYVTSWAYTYIKNDISTTEDDAFVNQKIATYMKNTRLGGHGMTLVGYNDEIWCDLNGNGRVDAGEKGAFKIANSWGTGDWNFGFRWVTYDSLYGTSQVASSSSWPTADRDSRGIFRGGDIYTLTVRDSYTPKVVAEFSINQIKRGQLYMTLGLGATTASTPSSLWYAEAIYGSGGSYAFDGTKVAKVGTFVFDFTDIVPSTTALKRWFIGMRDSSAGDTSIITSFKLYQVTGNGDVLVGTCTDVPKTADGSQSYVWIDYQYNSNNSPPTASVSASPTSGVAPLSVNFDGSASSDQDGSIVSYKWSFGDGSLGNGVAASHSYTSPGSYEATLTVTDDDDAKGTTSKTITVTAAVNNAPDAVAMSNASSGIAPLTVAFDGSASEDTDGTITSYSWSFGDGVNGSGATIAHVYVSAGNFVATLTVKDNSGATDSASVQITVTAAPANKAPSAVISANSTSGDAPLAVSFSGSTSSDPDGSIQSYQWNFGDGKTGSGLVVVHSYTDAGTYTAVLTVTDNNGATGTSIVVITVTTKAPDVLNAPSNLVARISTRGVTLSWIDNSNIESGFYIERATRAGNRYMAFTVIAEVTANVVSFIDSPSHGTYIYRICAFNSNGISEYSNLATVHAK